MQRNFSKSLRKNSVLIKKFVLEKVVAFFDFYLTKCEKVFIIIDSALLERKCLASASRHFFKIHGGDYMLLELKKVFLTEGESLETSFEFLLGEELQARRFEKPVKADVLVRNRAGLITLDADVELEVIFDCDRCGKSTTRVLNYHFEHILVLSLSNESSDEYIEVPDYNLEIEDLLRDDIFLEFPKIRQLTTIRSIDFLT